MTTFPNRRDRRQGPVLVLGNGLFPSRRRLAPFLRRAALVVCCDGAADKALRQRAVPDLLIGDLDSASVAARKKAARTVRIGEQDSTDLEKALAWLDRNGWGRRQTVLAGFTGGRTDFTLYNLHLLKRFAARDLVMIDDLFTIVPARSGRPRIGLRKGSLVSLLPLSRTTGVTTTGLEWDLEDATLEPGGLESASNRAAASTVTVRYRRGFLLWFLSADKG
jgi:thiamine pyrophosphokinase